MTAAPRRGMCSVPVTRTSQSMTRKVASATPTTDRYRASTHRGYPAPVRRNRCLQAERPDAAGVAVVAHGPVVHRVPRDGRLAAEAEVTRDGVRPQHAPGRGVQGVQGRVAHELGAPRDVQDAV